MRYPLATRVPSLEYEADSRLVRSLGGAFHCVTLAVVASRVRTSAWNDSPITEKLPTLADAATALPALLCC